MFAMPMHIYQILLVFHCKGAEGVGNVKIIIDIIYKNPDKMSETSGNKSKVKDLL